MIGFVRGDIADKQPTGEVVVDVNGVGYVVLVPDPSAVPPVGEPVQFHTHLAVREDAMTLYGFASRSDMRVFELLLRASGVGPKTALSALATMPAETLAAAIATGDDATLTNVPGIGRKGAQKIVVELRDRIAHVIGVDPEAAVLQAASDAVAGGVAAEAREALVALGYTPTEAHRAVSAVPADSDVDVAGLVRLALRAARA